MSDKMSLHKHVNNYRKINLEIQLNYKKRETREMCFNIIKIY